MKVEIVQTQSWRYKTTAVIKRQQQITISIKETINKTPKNRPKFRFYSVDDLFVAFSKLYQFLCKHHLYVSKHSFGEEIASKLWCGVLGFVSWKNKCNQHFNLPPTNMHVLLYGAVLLYFASWQEDRLQSRSFRFFLQFRANFICCLHLLGSDKIK